MGFEALRRVIKQRSDGDSHNVGENLEVEVNEELERLGQGGRWMWFVTSDLTA